MVNDAQNTQGKWILVDYLNREDAGLLAIGTENYSGASVRKNLDVTGRELLMERIRQCVDTGTAIDEKVEHRGRVYHVRVEPVLAPLTGTAVGVLAVYDEDGTPFPDRPKAGALEWRISFDGHIETAWNDDLYDIYELERTGPSPTGDMNQWVSQLISPEDRARMKITIDASIKSMNARRYLVPYRIITRFNTANPGHKNLEVSGRVLPDEATGGKWLRAMTREVSEITPSPITPEFGDYQSSSMLRAVFDLVVDRIMLAVDTSCWQTFMVSHTWEKFGLMVPRYGYLPHVIYPGDYRLFRDAVEESVPGRETTIRFLHADGSYRPYTVTSSNGHDRSGTDSFVAANERYVVVKLKPEDDAS